MTPSRLRTVALLGFIVLAVLLGLAWSQPWFTLQVADAPLEVPGSVAGGAVLPLALTTGALVAALAIAGPGFRVVLGALGALLGVTIAAVSIFALADPAGASAQAITDATGISGRGPVHDLVTASTPTAWPVAALVLGVLVIAAGVFVVATGRRWPRSGDRYDRTRTAGADADAPDAVTDWDALSDGDDPTAAR